MSDPHRDRRRHLGPRGPRAALARAAEVGKSAACATLIPRLADLRPQGQTAAHLNVRLLRGR